jgi:hypothetical protein
MCLLCVHAKEKVACFFNPSDNRHGVGIFEITDEILICSVQERQDN